MQIVNFISTILFFEKIPTYIEKMKAGLGKIDEILNLINNNEIEQKKKF